MMIPKSPKSLITLALIFSLNCAPSFDQKRQPIIPARISYCNSDLVMLYTNERGNSILVISDNLENIIAGRNYVAVEYIEGKLKREVSAKFNPGSKITRYWRSESARNLAFNSIENYGASTNLPRPNLKLWLD